MRQQANLRPHVRAAFHLLVLRPEAVESQVGDGPRTRQRLALLGRRRLRGTKVRAPAHRKHKARIVARRAKRVVLQITGAEGEGEGVKRNDESQNNPKQENKTKKAHGTARSKETPGKRHKKGQQKSKPVQQ